MPNFSPLRYPGGKYKIYSYIESLVTNNNCSTYIEPFAGGSAIALSLLINGTVNKIIINDYDRSIYALWYSIKYLTNHLINLIQNTEITMDEWYRQKNIQNNKHDVTLLELGFSTLFLNRTNRSGIIKAGVIGGKNQDGNYRMDCRFPKEKIINKIRLISEHGKRIDIYNMDAEEFIHRVIKSTRKSFTFFDPPYFTKGPSLYTNFYTENDHFNLANTIKTTLKNRKWIVSYDYNDKIKSFYSNLDFIEYHLQYTVQNKTNGIEYMFFSNNLNIGTPSLYLKTI